MVRLHALSAWTLVDDTCLPSLWADLVKSGTLVDGDSFSDQPTSQPAAALLPDPNLVVLELKLNPAAYAWLLDQPNYGPGAILWSEPA